MPLLPSLHRVCGPGLLRAFCPCLPYRRGFSSSSHPSPPHPCISVPSTCVCLPQMLPPPLAPPSSCMHRAPSYPPALSLPRLLLQSDTSKCLQNTGSQHTIPRPAASALPDYLLERQILKLHPRPTKSEAKNSGSAAADMCLDKPSGRFRWLMFENHCTTHLHLFILWLSQTILKCF